MERKINEKFYLNKAVWVIYLVNISQIILILGLIIYSYLFKEEAKMLISENLRGLFAILFIVFFINTYITTRDINILKTLNSQYFIQEKVLNQIEDLNNTLRAQRHDFLNHLQVVYSLMEMNEYDEASNYIEKVYEDIKKVNRVLKTSNIAINALLQAKQLDCEERGIVAHLEIATTLDKLIVPSWEMCRILGNLIDNAIDATEENVNKLIQIDISEELKNYKFIVKNNGVMIHKDIQDKIFQPGFSTKGEKGQGMGLAISKGIVDKYRGEIELESNETYTVFEVTIPFEQ